MKFFRGVAICASLGHCNSSAPLDEISLLQARRHRNVEIDCSVCLPRCRTTTTSNTPEPGLGPMKSCSMWGDPHVNTFDGFWTRGKSNWESLDAYKTGDFWFVKAPNVQIQGRTWADQSGHNVGKSSLRKVVLTGSCTGGKVLIVEPVGWWAKRGRIRFGGQTLHEGDGSVAEYQDEFVHIKPHADRYRSLEASSAESILITFPQDPSVEIFVMRASNYLDMMVSMNERVGVSGICGNMNGNGVDDADFMSSLASAVPDNEVMFVTPMYELHGCATVTSRENDFPADIAHMTAHDDLDIVEACAYECKGYVEGATRDAFILYEDGGRTRCRCGRKSKARHPIFSPNTQGCTENNCAAGIAPLGKTCVFGYDISHAADSDADCDQMTNNAGRVFCKSKLDPADTGYDGLLTACITDYCLVGRDVAGVDAEFSNEADQVEAEVMP